MEEQLSLVSEMLLGILLACLSGMLDYVSFFLYCNLGVCGQTYLRRLANLLSDDLPLVGLVFLDCVQERGALLLSQRQGYVRIWGYSHLPHPQQTLHNACPVTTSVLGIYKTHAPGSMQGKRERTNLVPMLLDTTLCPAGESL